MKEELAPEDSDEYDDLIMEYDGELPRSLAEELALKYLRSKECLKQK